jgi:hypothetical protein
VYVIDAVHLQRVGGNASQLGLDFSMLSNSNVDGFSLSQVLSWSDVEPSDGTFLWQTMDALIAQAAGAGKKVSIGILPGWKTPSWVYSEGAQSFNFIWDQTIWGPPLCSVATIPVPWDPIYLAKWGELIQAFGARYNGNYTVANVKLMGVSSEDEETNLPLTANAHLHSGTTSCTGYNNPVNWQKIGYTRTLIENTWQEIAITYQQAFPNKLLTAVLQPGGFPPIDANGNIFKSSNGADPRAPSDIMAVGVAGFGVQFTLQNDALSSTWIWNLIENYSSQIVTGYQTLQALGSGLPTAMDTAIAGGANYLELYEGDLKNPQLTAAIASAHRQLQ